jgi:hypothetical protein
VSVPATFQVVEVKQAATGVGKRGAWTLYIVKGDDGREYSTFEIGTIKTGQTITVFYDEVQKNGKTQRRLVDAAKVAEASHPANLADVTTRLKSIEAKVDQLLEYYNAPLVNKDGVPF